ncbi:hypothetical protein BH11ACT2_BH11ACT2_17000 [soil metagenome]
MDAPTRTVTHVELMKTLDEKFIASALMFEEAMLVASVVVDGSQVRGAGGQIDRERLRRIVARAISNTPSLRLRLRNTPLGVTAPAWVDSGDPSLDYHLRFSCDLPPHELSEGAALSGRANGEMRLDKPLWDVLVTELEADDVSIIIRAHHAFGDGMYGLRILDAMTEDAPFDPETADIAPSAQRAPTTGAGILLAAYRDWLAEFPFGRVAWGEYWRKPFLKRMKRWVGRMLRGRRRRSALKAGLPAYLSQRKYEVVRFDFRAARARARELGGTVNDLVVASALKAAAIANAEQAEVSMLVPISHKSDRSGDERNHVSMALVIGDTALSFEQLVPAVHAQIERCRAGEEPIAASRKPEGYATYLPWNLRRQFFGPAPVKTVTLWPTIAPDEQLAVLASSYHDTITFAMIANREVDTASLVETMRADVAPQVSEAS